MAVFVRTENGVPFTIGCRKGGEAGSEGCSRCKKFKVIRSGGGEGRGMGEAGEREFVEVGNTVSHSHYGSDGGRSGERKRV